MIRTPLELHRLLPLLLLLLLTACDSASSEDASSEVVVRFAAVSSPGASVAGRASSSPGATADELTVAGSNGTLTITDIRLIVAEFELERSGCDDADDEGADGGPECEDFEAPPAFVDLPLGTGAVTVATAEVPEGLYEELEFEVEDLDLDEEEDAEIADLDAAVRAAFPEWPDEASAVVGGTFTPTDGGAPRPFTVYLAAEIEVELEFAPPFEVRSDGGGEAPTVEVYPTAWFARGDGTVLDLSAYDYGETGELLEFELELERGLNLEVDGD